ncbi:WhiB family transcriptional regulator [Embleya sp. NPDC050154]|uniref:WhiB family transcriptional regulator n=1 Tax=Embleya sp. NPDC050154 TaxID=3363988 RepID=UPI00378E1B45
MSGQGWRSRAACAGMSPELFVGPDGPESSSDRYARNKVARQVCGRCPVVEECGAAAVVERDRWAVRGGTTGSGRRAARARGRAA